MMSNTLKTIESMMRDGAKSGAVFDRRVRYRYLLWREWEPAGKRIAFLMLNPSSADAYRNDPTIAKCAGFARRWGYTRMDVVNLFAFRTADPFHLFSVRDPIGRFNDHFIDESVAQCDAVLLAWGNDGGKHIRARVVAERLQERNLLCLGLTGSGHPRHPLYIRGDAIPQLWDRREWDSEFPERRLPAGILDPERGLPARIR